VCAVPDQLVAVPPEAVALHREAPGLDVAHTHAVASVIAMIAPAVSLDPEWYWNVRKGNYWRRG